MRERIDAKGQKTLFEYNVDDTRRRVSYPNALVATPAVAFEYDEDYPRVVQMTDGIGTSLYSYHRAGATPRLGANRLARVDGPLPNATVTYDYDEFGAVRSVGVNGDARTIERDVAGRVTGETNALGNFTYTYVGASNRLDTETYPNGQTVEYGYGTVEQDFDLRRITNEVNGTLLSEFTYERDVAAGRITTWTQAASGEPTKTYTFGYDAANQLTSATLAVSGQPDEVTTYSYDTAGNRLTELTDGVGTSYSYNAVNQLTSISGATPPEATYQWDAQDRLVGVTTGATALSFGYDGLSRLASVLVATSGTPAEDRRYVWSGNEIAAEAAESGFVARRFHPQGMSIAPGLQQGVYYARDHLGSIREVVDGVGATRARYAYSPFGIRTKIAGDVSSEFGFAGLLQPEQSMLTIARYRAYDPQLGLWMSRDPLGEWAGANPLFESWFAPNLYPYVNGNPVNFIDPTGQQAAIPWGPIFGGAAAGAALGGAVGALTGAALVCFFVPGDSSQPDDAECDKQWSDAYRKCAEWITSKQTPAVKRLRGSRNGRPYNLDDCARGHVSAACGGNPI
ncbi:MAG: hypothetical protein M3020_00020 [Myxococcota bacterium]|nr:hypothetical protein [Myxococcota bacterium]